MDDVAIALWGSRTLPAVLAHLTARPAEELTLGQLQVALGANRESLHRALQRALATSVVVRRRVGSQYVYRADESSPFYPEVRSLCSKVLGPAGILTAALRTADPHLVEQAFIYGSGARGGERPRSDIDVLVLGGATDFDLSDMLRDAAEQIVRTVNASTYTRREVEDAMARGDGFLLEVWAQPKIMLVGREEDLPEVPERMRR
jgi:predicted nucleotidyltransferase